MSEDNTERIAEARGIILQLWRGSWPKPGEMIPKGEIEEGIVDLITNLLHLALAEGLDTEAILRMATNHLEEER